MVDTLHPPESVIATWPKPNYVDPITRGSGLVYLCIVFAALGVITVSARMYSRLFITKAPGLDDLLVLIALGFLVSLNVLVIIGNRRYFSGRHVWDIPPTAYVEMRINVWASLWCYIIGVTLIKISVLLFYRRLSVKFSKTFLIATWAGIVYNVLYIVTFGLTLLLICTPLHSYWDSFSLTWPKTHTFHCGRENAALPASSAFSVAGDFYSTLLPLILVYYLDLPRRQKFALYGLFALGFMAVVAGVVRTVLMYHMLNVDYDFTWELYITWIWAVLELYLALFAASAPSLKPFFKHFFVDSLNSLTKSSRRRGGTGGGYAHGGGGLSANNDLEGPTTELTSVKGSGAGVFVSESEPKGYNKGNGPFIATENADHDVERSAAGGGMTAERRKRTSSLTAPWRLHLQREEDPDRAASQQSWYMGETASTPTEESGGTKHFELRASEDGKRMIPTRVYKHTKQSSSQASQLQSLSRQPSTSMTNNNNNTNRRSYTTAHNGINHDSGSFTNAERAESADVAEPLFFADVADGSRRHRLYRNDSTRSYREQQNQHARQKDAAWPLPGSARSLSTSPRGGSLGTGLQQQPHEFIASPRTSAYYE